MLKIRLMRIGAKKKPFYRVVAVDERSKRTGLYIELLGTYNPLTEPKDIKIKQDRIDYWIKQGAQMSTGFLRVIGKAPQRLPRKPKKEAKQATSDSGQAKTEEPAATTEEVAPEQPVKEAAKSETEELQDATEVKTDEDSRLSEAGEASSESTSSDVHEPDRADSEPPTGGKEAELENQDQANEGASSDERSA